MYFDVAEEAAFSRLVFIADRKRLSRADIVNRIAYHGGARANGWYRVDGAYRHYLNGLLHNAPDGPAYFSERSMGWAEHGKPHNLHGPAVIVGFDRTTTWAINGRRMTLQQFLQVAPISDNEKTRLMLAWANIPKKTEKRKA